VHLLIEIPITDAVDDETSADAASDLCHFTVRLRRSRVSEESAEKNDERKSLGVCSTAFPSFVDLWLLTIFPKRLLRFDEAEHEDLCMGMHSLRPFDLVKV